MAVKLYEFKSAVRGYHYYMKFWSPVENQVLDCVHEVDNPYDFFAIKTMEKRTGRIVGHLPFEVARCIKFLLQRGAIIDAQLSTTNYRRSPLIQGGLEIPCNVTVMMPRTVINKKIIEKLEVLLDLLYIEPDASAIIGSFIHHTIDISTPKSKPSKIVRKGKKRKSAGEEENQEPEKQRQKTVKDIRTYFTGNKSSSTKNKNKTSKPQKPIIVID